METLQRYWHWHRNERPSAEATQTMRAKHLSPLAEHALSLAVAEIVRRHSPADVEAQNDALRDLSVEFCRALEKMREIVPEGPPLARALHAGRRVGKSVLQELLSAEMHQRIEEVCKGTAPGYLRTYMYECVGVTAAHLAAHGKASNAR